MGEKIGVGVKQIEVRPNFHAAPKPFSSRGFWITRMDGSEDSFSYMKCLSPDVPEVPPIGFVAYE